MGVTTHSRSRNPVRLALVTNPPLAASGTPTGVPAGLRLLRTLDRAVLEVARTVDLRPMELYALLLLSQPDGACMTTRRLSEVLAASPSQAKQIALRLSSRGLAVRTGGQGRTSLTDEGQELALYADERLQDEIAMRVAQVEAGALSQGTSTISQLLSTAV